jgi:flagellin-like hook-associated protein FlgL
VEISGYSTADVLSQLIGFSAPTRSSTTSTSDTAYDNMSSVDLSKLAPTIAIADTLSDSATAVSIVTLKAGSLEGLAEILNKMRTLTEVAFSASVAGDIEEYDRALLEIQDAETEISKFIGNNLASPASLSTSLVESTGGFEKRFFQILDMSDVDGFDLLASVEVDLASVLTHAHSPAGCPICEANLSKSADLSDGLSNISGVSGAGGTANPSLTAAPTISVANVESDSTATTKDSVGSAATTIVSSGTGYIDPLVKGLVWDLSAGETLSYSFYNGTVGYSDYVNIYSQPNYPGSAAALNTTQQTEMREVYDLWSIYAPFDFEEVTETATGDVVGDLRVAYMTDTTLNTTAAAFAYYPYQNAIGGDTWYILDGVQNAANNATYATNLTFSDDTYGRITALHEIGHSIGLSHPFDGGSLSTQTLTGNGYTDDMRLSVMSYTNSVDNQVYYKSGASLASKQVYSNTPMVYDIAAVEYLYGAITDANLGDTTYDMSNHQQIQTLVDSGGTDTIDLSSTLFRSVIDLTPGSLSSVGYATETEQEAYWATQGFSLAAVQSYITSSDLFTGQDNLGIAFSATIENVLGSAGDDQITGNDADNVIKGGLGDDTITGGSGDDYAVFAGNFADYTISTSGATTTVTDNNTADGDEGVDSLSGVEFIEFSDFTYSVATGITTSTRTGGALAGLGNGTSSASVLDLKPEGKIIKAPPHKLSGLNIADQESAMLAIKQIDIALEYVSGQISSLGSAINQLVVVGNSLANQKLNTQAARSRIQDADFATEIAHLLKNQVLQQAGRNILLASSMSPKLALQLLA